MFKTTMPKTKLLEVLRINRDQHRAIFEKAQEAYKARAIELLEQQLEAARRSQPWELQPLQRLAVPEDHTPDYERIIGMMEESSEELIELDETSYASYVQDDWSWKRQWVATNTMYGVSAG